MSTAVRMFGVIAVDMVLLLQMKEEAHLATKAKAASASSQHNTSDSDSLSDSVSDSESLEESSEAEIADDAGLNSSLLSMYGKGSEAAAAAAATTITYPQAGTPTLDSKQAAVGDGVEEQEPPAFAPPHIIAAAAARALAEEKAAAAARKQKAPRSKEQQQQQQQKSKAVMDDANQGTCWLLLPNMPSEMTVWHITILIDRLLMVCLHSVCVLLCVCFGRATGLLVMVALQAMPHPPLANIMQQQQLLSQQNRHTMLWRSHRQQQRNSQQQQQQHQFSLTQKQQ